MRRLNLFENFKTDMDIPFHVQTIKDVFQDVIDEYEISPRSSGVGILYEIDDITKSFPKFTKKNNVQIMVDFWISVSEGKVYTASHIKLFSKISEDIEREIIRLKTMGYIIMEDESNKGWDIRYVFYVDCSNA